MSAQHLHPARNFHAANTVGQGATACIDAQDNGGDTPLHVAAAEGYGSTEGQGRVLEKLLELGADPSLRNTAGDSILHVAAAGGHAVMVARLVDFGVAVNARNNRGSTALLNAANRSDLDMVTLLLDGGASSGIANDNGTTPLMAAATHGHIAICTRGEGGGQLHGTRGQRRQDRSERNVGGRGRTAI